jgi:hypothetical protein
MPVKAPWVPTSQLHPCPICGRDKRLNRCFFIPDQVVQCYYEPSKFYRKSGAGDCWLHFLGDRPDRERKRGTRHVIVRGTPTREKRYDLPRLAAKFQARLSTPRLNALAVNLGVSSASLKRLNLGWTDGEMMYVQSRGEERAQYAWSFPRRDADGKVIGISLRPRWGNKYAWTDSGAGLHIPTDFISGGRAFICEGPSDTAAAIDLGLNAFGRSSCSSDLEFVLPFIRRHELQQLVIFSQCDEIHYRLDGTPYYPAQDGAEELASQARLYVRDVRIIMPPPAAPEDKDVRDWKRHGHTGADVEQLINQSKPRAMRIAVVVHARKGNGVCHTKTI